MRRSSERFMSHDTAAVQELLGPVMCCIQVQQQMDAWQECLLIC
jgi:hypothetical protein